MTQVVTGLFDTYADAERAVRSLRDAGIPQDDISLVANNSGGEHDSLVHVDRGSAAAADAGKGAEIGGVVGGIGGLLAGLGMLAIPGVGPVVAAGWLGATLIGALGGAAVGGVAGGLVGALTDAGVPEEQAHVYAEGVRRGGTVVSARVDDNLVSEARSILNRSRNVDVDERAAAYRNEGWSRFDENGPGYTA